MAGSKASLPPFFMCGHKMQVGGEESETDMASENGEPMATEEGGQEFAFKNKYKELKSRLKYLVYVSRGQCKAVSVMGCLNVCTPPPLRCRNKSAMN